MSPVEAGSSPIRIEHFPINGRRLRVQRVVNLTPRMVRITLGGDEIAGLRTASPLDHVKLFFPEPGSDEVVMPTVGPDGWQLPEGVIRPQFRDYTIRALRYDDAGEPVELDIDFVLHPHGLAGVWAGNARPGDLIGVLGPAGSKFVSHELDWFLLAGDETALPSLCRWAEELPAGARALMVIEVADESEKQPVTSVADLDLRWVFRDGAAPGSSNVLEQAVRELRLPDGDGYVWVAGEAGVLKPIRRYVRRELGLPADFVEVDGYWKRGVVNLDHDADDEDEAELDAELGAGLDAGDA